MNLLEVLHVVATLLVWIAVAMVPPTIVASFEGLTLPWLSAMAVTAAVGGILWLVTPKRLSINPREGLATVGLGWLAVVLAGSLPFIFAGTAGPVQALFESVSGFTTTGATIFPVVEDLPHSILLWRSITHWLGGMGIIVLGVAILPLIGVGGAQLFRAEVPGVSGDRLTPRVASTARLLWMIYAVFTTVIGVVYLLLGMPLFDAINHAMSVLATGGFSTRAASIGAYSPAIQTVTIFAMILAGTNFTLTYRFLQGNWKAWVSDVEWRWFAGALLLGTASVFAYLGFVNQGWSVDWLRAAAFSVTAVVTTTGFGIADFAAWPAFCQVVLLGLMFVGAMGGSTGGGFKVVRAVVVVKHTVSEIRKVLHPRAVIVTKLGKTPVRPDVLLNVLAFLAIYVGTHGLGTILLTAMGYDLVTAASAALAAMSSIGPGLGEVGPASNYAGLSSMAHITLSALMLLGRLEFYTLMVLFIPRTWSRWGGNR